MFGIRCRPGAEVGLCDGGDKGPPGRVGHPFALAKQEARDLFRPDPGQRWLSAKLDERLDLLPLQGQDRDRLDPPGPLQQALEFTSIAVVGRGTAPVAVEKLEDVFKIGRRAAHRLIQIRGRGEAVLLEGIAGLVQIVQDGCWRSALGIHVEALGW